MIYEIPDGVQNFQKKKQFTMVFQRILSLETVDYN